MSKKSPKIALLLDKFIRKQDEEKGADFDPHYLGYFECFNRQMYYEAHDVLEELWLVTKGRKYLFYKGLIQLAGAFVHLKKSRLNPAARLFRLALKNLEPSTPVMEGLDVQELIARIHNWLTRLEDSDHANNPYNADDPPHIALRD